MEKVEKFERKPWKKWRATRRNSYTERIKPISLGDAILFLKKNTTAGVLKNFDSLVVCRKILTERRVAK